jgi:hypothetical protein
VESSWREVTLQFTTQKQICMLLRNMWLSSASKDRDATSRSVSVPRTVTKGRERAFILTSGGPVKNKEKEKKDDEQKTPAYYPRSLYQPLHRTTLGFRHNSTKTDVASLPSTGLVGLEPWMMTKRAWKFVNRKTKTKIKSFWHYPQKWAYILFYAG